MRKNERDYPEVFSEISKVVIAELRRRVNISDGDATTVADRVVEELRAKLGGRELYIPKAAWLDLSKRDREIYRKFRNGWSIRDLQRETGLTKMRLTTIINTGRKKLVDASQHKFQLD